ncbi:hypothetical protein ACWJJH_07215 [Endozoicomonadaceae bacterium StTr2]
MIDKSDIKQSKLEKNIKERWEKKLMDKNNLQNMQAQKSPKWLLTLQA